MAFRCRRRRDPSRGGLVVQKENQSHSRIQKGDPQSCRTRNGTMECFSKVWRATLCLSRLRKGGPILHVTQAWEPRPRMASAGQGQCSCVWWFLNRTSRCLYPCLGVKFFPLFLRFVRLFFFRIVMDVICLSIGSNGGGSR